MPRPADRRFGRSTYVHRYWLLRCEGFVVLSAGGRRLGVVEDVRADAGTRRAVSLAVRTRGPLRRRRLVPAEAVQEVAPWEEAIVLAARPKGERRRIPRRRLVRRGLRILREGVGVGLGAANEALRVAEPHARRAARSAGAYAAAAAQVVLLAARTHGPPAGRAAGRAARAFAVRSARAAGAASVFGARAARAGLTATARWLALAGRIVRRLALRTQRAARAWQRRHAPAVRRRAADWLDALHRGH